MTRKPRRGGPRPGAGRPVTTGRSLGRPITISLSPEERTALEAAAGSPSAVGRYLRGAGLVLPQILACLDSAGDTLTDAEAVRLALGNLRQVLPADARSTARGKDSER